MASKRFRRHFSLCLLTLHSLRYRRDIYSTGNESSSRSFRSCANRAILALLLKASPSYKRGNAFNLDSGAWTYRERGGKRAIIAQAAAHNTFGSGKKYAVSERTSEPAADRPIPPIELSRGLVAIGLVLVAWLQCKREPCYNSVVKRKTADENPSFDCCTLLSRVARYDQGQGWILRQILYMSFTLKFLIS